MCAGAWDQVELTIQHSSQLPTHPSTPDQPDQHTLSQLQQPMHRHRHDQARQQQQQQRFSENDLPGTAQQPGLNGGLPHQQPVPSPFASAQNGQAEWPTTQQQQQTHSEHRYLPGTGSKPMSVDQHQLPGHNQLQGSSYSSAPGQDLQGQLLATGQGLGLGPAAGGSSGLTDEHEAAARAAGLDRNAEEELRGLSRLEEDALEAKVAGPIGLQFCPPLSCLLSSF